MNGIAGRGLIQKIRSVTLRYSKISLVLEKPTIILSMGIHIETKVQREKKVRTFSRRPLVCLVAPLAVPDPGKASEDAAAVWWDTGHELNPGMVRTLQTAPPRSQHPLRQHGPGSALMCFSPGSWLGRSGRRSSGLMGIQGAGESVHA